MRTADPAIAPMENPIRIKKEASSTGSSGSEQQDVRRSLEEGKATTPNTGKTADSEEKTDEENVTESGMHDDVSLTFPQRVRRTVEYCDLA